MMYYNGSARAFSTRSRVVQLAFFTLVALIFPAHAQTLAFPGALGYGAYASGGRNGTVYHVTNLNDSGAGSFRDAVSHSGRTVVFDVGGHVNLVTAVSCQGNLTIAGQTAPGGICFDGGEVAFAGRANVICRYIRVRPGSDTISTGDDCISLYQATNCILDHLSIAFGPWNNIDAVTCHNISVQHCIDANPTGQQFGAHIENVGAFYSWQYNIFANSHNRNPLAKINDTFINNVLYNCSAGYTTHTSTHFSHDIINNYFVAGPAYGSSADFPWFQVDNNQAIHYSGNLFDSNENGTLDGSTTTPYWYQGGSGGTVLASPWSSWTSIIPTMTAPLAWRYDVSASGAFPRDDVDSLLISQVKTVGSGSAGTGAGTAGPNSGLYTSQTQTGLGNNGYGSITGGTAPSNFSGDGIADYWKLANGMNTNTSYPLTNTASGYTLLENYLNFLAAPHAVTRTNSSVDVSLTQFTGGFSGSAVFGVTNPVNGTVTLTGGSTAHFVPTANFNGLGSFNFTVTESGNGLNVTVAVCVTPVAPPASATSFYGAIMSPATNGVTLPTPSDLLWQGDGTANTWNTSAANWLNGTNPATFKNGDSVTFDDSGSNTPAITVSGTLSPGSISFDDDQNYTISGPGSWSGSGSLSKSGAGTLTINTTNSSYTGAVSVNGGAFTIGPSANIGTGPIDLSGGAVFTIAGGGTGVAVPGAISVADADTATLSAGQLANNYSGNLSADDTNTVLYLSSGVSFSGSSASQFAGFYGTIDIPAGSALRFSVNSSGNTFASLNNKFVIDGTLEPRNAGNTIQLGAFTGASTGILRGPQSNAGTGNSLYIIGGNDTDANFSGVISSNTATPGSQVVVSKIGAGTLTLSGNSTYTGGTTVNAGTLKVNSTTGSGTGSGALEIVNNATLAGNGIIGSATTVDDGGWLSPGDPTGRLTISNNLTLNDNSLLLFDLGTSSDSVFVSGDLVLTGFLIVQDAGGFGPGVYTLFTCTGSLTFGNFTLADAPGDYNFSIDTNTPGVVKLVVSPTTPPYFTGTSLTSGGLSLVGSNGVPLGYYVVWESQNLTNWTPLVTNQFDSYGGFNFSTNAPFFLPQDFFRLQLQQ